MIADIKTYACGIIIVGLLVTIGLGQAQLTNVKSEYKTYKDSINDQLQKAEIKKARIDAEQRAKHDKEVADLAADRDRLKRILDRLPKSKVVSGNEALRVAGDSSGGVPGKAEDTGITFTELATREGTCESSFYADALETTLICKRLIEFVSK
jgi:hypothetical protein